MDDSKPNEDTRCKDSKNEKAKVKKYQCDKCELCFPFTSHLNRHQKSVHDKILDHKCDLCDKTFTRFDSLKRHKQTNHCTEEEKANAKIYQCNNCGVSFSFE